MLFAAFPFGRIGIAMQASSQNQLAAYYMGIPMESIRVAPDVFGTPESWSPTNYLASPESRLSQLQDGRWRAVLDYAQMK